MWRTFGWNSQIGRLLNFPLGVSCAPKIPSVHISLDLFSPSRIHGVDLDGNLQLVSLSTLNSPRVTMYSEVSPEEFVEPRRNSFPLGDVDVGIIGAHKLFLVHSSDFCCQSLTPHEFHPLSLGPGTGVVLLVNLSTNHILLGFGSSSRSLRQDWRPLVVITQVRLLLI